jgi:hypothetical protein
MSGLQIFNAHPALYWGSRSSFDDPILSIAGNARPLIFCSIGSFKPPVEQ